MKPKPYFKISPRVDQSWTVTELCVARGLTAPIAKGGGRLAILELGGGWVQSDLDLFSKSENLPNIVVHDISVDGKTNNSKDPTQDASGEVALDIQAAFASYYRTCGVAPVSVDILWGSDLGDLVEYAGNNGYDVLSSSWGAPERQWGRGALSKAAGQVKEALGKGLTICAAAGDNSSSDGTRGTNVDALASIPGVIACGGTSWPNSPNAVEKVWGNGNPSAEGTGGGYSAYFKAPTYQVGIPGNAPGKMVPDIADVADPETGIRIAVAGTFQVIGGTSFVAPFISGFLCGLGPKLGSVYSKIWTRPGAFKDIVVGSNGRYRAQAGPDPCTGLGCIIAPQVAALLGE